MKNLANGILATVQSPRSDRFRYRGKYRVQQTRKSAQGLLCDKYKGRVVVSTATLAGVIGAYNVRVVSQCFEPMKRRELRMKLS